MIEDLDDLWRPPRGARDLMTEYQSQWYERARRMKTSGPRLRGKSGYAILDDAAFGHWPERSAPITSIAADPTPTGPGHDGRLLTTIELMSEVD